MPFGKCPKMADAQKSKFIFTSAEEILSRPDLTVEIVDELTKDQLCAVAQSLGVKVFSGARKSYLNRTVCHALVQNGLLESDKSTLTQSIDPKDQVEILKLQLKLKETDKESREKEMAHEIKLKELKTKELEVQSSNVTKGFHSGFDVGKNIRLVPKFDCKEVTRYFTSFEDLAKKLEWPKKYWTTLLHCVFDGKAKEVYTALSSEQSADYDVVKQTVLKPYELVPEAYRQTYVEFAREVDKRFDKMRELLLIEEFKSCLPSGIRTHLADRGVNKLEKAAIMADDFELVHKQSFCSDNRHNTSRSKLTKSWLKKGEQTGKTTQSIDFKLELDPTKGKENPVGSSERSNWRKNRLICSFCGKIGHTFEKCCKRRDQFEKLIALLASQSRGVPHGEVLLSKGNVENSDIDEIPLKVATEVKGQVTKPMNNGYEAFMSHGHVSVKENIESHVVDTGAAQSLLLKGVVPSLGESSQTSVLIKGVEGGYLKIPLETIHLESVFRTGPVTVGIVPSLPVEGVTFLLGNDIAGTRVQGNPCAQVTNAPHSHSSVDTERLLDQYPRIFPACVTTRSMARASQNEDTVEHLRASDECFKLAGTFF